MSRFLRAIVTLTALTHVPFVIAVREIARRLDVASGLAWGIGGLAGVLGVLGFLGRARHVMEDSKRSWASTSFVDVPYYWHWCTCIYCMVPSVVYLIFEPIVALARGAPLAYTPSFFLWVYLSGLLVCGYGVFIRRRWVITRRVDVPLKGLAKELDGYTIVQLSDLHIGALTPPSWGLRWARQANAQKADMVVVTGDMVTSGVAWHDDIGKVIGALEGKDGVFVSMGNHDYFGEGEPLVSRLLENGARVLRNEGLPIERDGAKFYLAAVDDTWTRRANLELALEARPEGMPTVLLAHDPDRFPQYAKRDVGLVLAGHTHGGQIAVPFLARQINASMLAHHYHLGAYKDGDSTLYVHPGLGTTGPPMRLGAAPAIVVFTLRAA